MSILRCAKPGEMDVESVFASLVLEQLKARNAIEATYTGVFADYQALLTTNRELQVPNLPLLSQRLDDPHRCASWLAMSLKISAVNLCQT